MHTKLGDCSASLKLTQDIDYCAWVMAVPVYQLVPSDYVALGLFQETFDNSEGGLGPVWEGCAIEPIA